jgi:hypothetical protein
MNKTLGILVFGCWLGMVYAEQPATVTVDLESGWVWPGRADVRIPGDAGTRFSLVNDLDADSDAYVRARIGWRPAARHVVMLTLAPLEATARGSLAEDTRFADTQFAAGSTVKATYRFNNYRATYRYRWLAGDRYYADVGGTIFVRDAKVVLASETNRDADDDLGLVPLLSFAFGWEAFPRFWLRMDGDALAAPQGRAVDILFSLDYVWGNGWETGLGYRVLDGGADNDTVYTFATFHHAAALLRYTW